MILSEKSATFRDHALALSLDRDSCFRSEAGQETPEFDAAEGNASGRRRAIRPRDMEKNRAAPSGDAGTGVVIDLDDEIVEAIVAPEPLARFAGRAPD